MAELTANLCNARLDRGGFVIVDNPRNSYLWLRPRFVELAKRSGMHVIETHNCMHGGERRKAT
eukprot:13470090-Heterocapsa_arctica.AAC.1